MALQPLGKDLAVAAMAAVDVVIDTQQVRLADGARLLPDRQVCRPAVIVLDALIRPAQLDLVQRASRRPG